MSSFPKRSFTIRVEHELYLKLGGIAQDEGTDMNATVNRLLLLGLGERESLLTLLQRLVNTEIARDAA